MANTYQLMNLQIDCSSGINVAIFNIKMTDPLTGVSERFERKVQSPPAPAQARLDGVITDALTYINSLYPGANVTTPTPS